MKVYFSKRHEDALRAKKLNPSFRQPLRISILRILERFSECNSYGGSRELDEAQERLTTFYGLDSLFNVDGGKRVPTDVAGLIRSGYPDRMLDALEAWFDVAPSKSAAACETELNDCLAMHRSDWRFVNGAALRIDSEYMHREVQARVSVLLREEKFLGAHEEFQSALGDLQTGDTKGAVIKAHKSVESTMKSVLDTQDHLTYGHLLNRLIASGIIPKYYEEFLVHFEKLSLAAVKERNRPGAGHGQGPQPIEVPRPLAEFAINLAGSLNLFMAQRWIESSKRAPNANSQPSEDGIPF